MCVLRMEFEAELETVPDILGNCLPDIAMNRHMSYTNTDVDMEELACPECRSYK